MYISYQIPRAALVWILVSVAAVMLPQSLRMPLWISAIAALCIVWRILIHTGKLNYPGRAVRVLVVIFTLVVSVSQMRNIGIGLDSAAALLTLGFVFKLIEMQQKRDIYVVICLCFVMSMVGFLYSQSVLSTLYILLCILAIVSAMIALNRSPRQSDHLRTSKMAGLIMLQALPLTVVLFVVFPRIAPLWAVPIQSTGNTTGVNDEMSPGDISRLGRSGDLAFRVQFEGAEPLNHEQLYWRGLVLSEFDGTTWRRGRSRSAFSVATAKADMQMQWNGRIEKLNEPIKYNVILEPTQKPWLYGLHLAESFNEKMFQSRNFELFNDGLVTQRKSYDLQSYLSSRTDVQLFDSAREQALELPASGNARSQEFARSLRASLATDQDYALAVLAYFAQNEFYYSLNPPLLGDDRIDEFLFESLEGFCEHYASTFTYLMRAAGIPARVVIGYQGAEYNPFENYFMVYQYNAHAWSEVWIEGRGWVRFDPTGAVSPDRISLGVEAALRDDPAFMQESLFSTSALGRLDWIRTLRLRLDAIEYEWNRRVDNYDEDVQFEFFEKLFGQVTEQKILMLLMGLASIAILAVALSVIRIEFGSRQDPINKQYARLSKELAKVGLHRLMGEGPLDYRDRVARSRPELKLVMSELTAAYIDAVYKSKAVPNDKLDKAVASLRQGVKNIKADLFKKPSHSS
jgi:transglutaminase-like putative cysteine protease